MGYNYVIANSYAGVEIYLDRGKGFLDLNKERFDQLYKYKNEIEKAFGGKLSWERLDKKRASRIAFRFEGVGLKDKDKWPHIQDGMIDVMIRLEAAFKPYIKQLK